MAQQLETLAVLAEDLGSIPSNHMGDSQSAPGYLVPSLVSMGTCTNTEEKKTHRYT